MVESYPAGGGAVQWTAFLVNYMVDNNFERKIIFNKDFNESNMSNVLKRSRYIEY